MCGIIGYVGRSLPIVSLLIKGLEDLEYRGYDSAGVVFILDGELKVVKKKGKVGGLADELRENGFFEVEGHIGMGHTRWATHGAPTSYNAHPIVDSEGEFAVVHNGIIENFLELRKELSASGYEFRTETDTEVIVYLTKKYYEGDIVDAVRKVVEKLKGAFAIGVMAIHEPDRIVLARLGSPLVVGLGRNGNYFASDATPLLRYTNKMVFLDEGMMAVVGEKGVDFMDRMGKPIEVSPVTIDWTPEMASKGGFEHYMLKEIKEEGRVVRESLEGRVTSDGISFPEIADMDVNAVRRVFIVACGTSYYAGMFGKYLFEEILEIPAEVEVASELRYRKFPVYPDDIAIFISQSGETADTLAALRLFKQKGIKTISLVNVKGSTIDRESDISLLLRAGPEIGVASTKAFIAQIMLLYLIVFQWAQQRGVALDIKKYASALLKLPYQVEEIFSNEEHIKKLAERYYRFTNFLYLGRWLYFPMALEGALKLKEISYIHAEGYPAGEMKHGPIALIDESMPVVAIIPEGYIFKKMLNNLEETIARKAPIIAVTTSGNSIIQRYTQDIIWIPKTLEIFMPMLSMVPLQLFAYYMAYFRGCEIDQPRNLAKSVTVE